MTTPLHKFFDTVKKVFPENQEQYFINHMGLVFRQEIIEGGFYANFGNETCEENIIDVPFTGKFDKKLQPIFKEDVLKSQNGRLLVVKKYINGGYFLADEKNIIYDLVALVDDTVIIGSSLTNPELL